METMVETRRRYHEELHQLKVDTVRMAAMAAEQIAGGTEALLAGDLSGAEGVIAGDQEIDDLFHSVEENAYHVLARQSPMASELRTIIATLRVVHEIERCGDLMVNVAKATRRLYPYGLDPKVRGLLERMGAQAGDQLRLAVVAFDDGDVVQAAAVEDMDDVMDDLTKALFRTIFAVGAPDESALQRAVQVALIGRYYERIADHAVNVSHRVRFVVTGILVDQEAERPQPGP
ncbi:MAG: phosphate signaling complex protein PhoU [Actinomycetota bacterium]|nr:phosphate signaling complex protein PhoU [Actinomycetota bacterium]MDQ3574954.1 phosphate signaling complex protein PhoU [Actinomycetota bacterium]